MVSITKRIESDKAAAGSVETILLITLAVFTILAVMKFVISPFISPIRNSVEGIDGEIEKILYNR